MAKKIDTNQKEIVRMLRNLGASVYITSELGKGFPDLVVGIGGTNFLFEVKSTSQKKLTNMESNFHEFWRGQVNVINDWLDAVKIINQTIRKISLT